MGVGPFDRARFPVHEDRAVSVPSPSSAILLTERLRLRPILTGDAVALFGVFGDPEAMRFWHASPRRNVAETAQLIRGYLAHRPMRSMSWAITYRDEPHPVGVVWIGIVDPASRGAELKFILGRHHWRQGLMAEALRRVLDHVFVDLALNRVQASRHVDDDRSASLLHRLSFQREGTLRQCVFVDSCYRDIELHSLLACDWLARATSHPVVVGAAPDARPSSPNGAARRD